MPINSWLPFGGSIRASATNDQQRTTWQKSIVASGASPTAANNMFKAQQQWQKRVLRYADAIPEVANTGSYVHNTLNLVQWRVEGTAAPEHLAILTNGLNRFMAGRAAENLFYVGEVLIGYRYDAANRSVKWSTYSHSEYKKSSGTVELLGKDGKFHSPESGQRIFRVHREDREKRFDAYSPHKSMLAMLEAWYLHQLVDARLAQSRLAGAGILHIPGNDLPSIPANGDGTPVPGSREQFLDEFIDSMLMPITDSNSDDAVVPFVMFGNADYAEAIRHVLLERLDSADTFATRMDAYAERYARGVDLPKEILLGTADANHWTAWKIDDDTATYYIQPAALRLAAPLTRNYAEPLLEVIGGTGRVEVVPDLSKIIARPDKTEPAARAFENGAITKEAYVREIGLTEDDIDDVGVPLRQAAQITPRNMTQSFTQSPPPGA